MMGLQENRHTANGGGKNGEIVHGVPKYDGRVAVFVIKGEQNYLDVASTES